MNSEAFSKSFSILGTFYLFYFDIVNLPFLDGDSSRRASFGVYISHVIRFARACNHVSDFKARNKCLTAKRLLHGYRYHKFKKLIGRNDFSFQFIKIKTRYRRIGYNLNVMRQSVCLV